MSGAGWARRCSGVSCVQQAALGAGLQASVSHLRQICLAVHWQWHFLLHINSCSEADRSALCREASWLLYLFPMGSLQLLWQRRALRITAAHSVRWLLSRNFICLQCYSKIDCFPRESGAAPVLVWQEGSGVPLWKPPLGCLLVSKGQGLGGWGWVFKLLNQADREKYLCSSRIRKQCIYWTSWSVSFNRSKMHWTHQQPAPFTHWLLTIGVRGTGVLLSAPCNPPQSLPGFVTKQKLKAPSYQSFLLLWIMGKFRT